MNQEELAARLGVSKSVISKYENGGIQLQEDTLRQMSIIFGGVSVDFILGMSDDRKQGTSRTSPKLAWDALELVEGADALSNESRQLLIDCTRNPEILGLVVRFLSLSQKSRRRAIEYVDMLKLADDTRAAERRPEPAASDE